MLNFAKAREAASEIRTVHLGNQPKADPIAWDMSLAIEALTTELDRRLGSIEQQQAEILRLLQRQR